MSRLFILLLTISMGTMAGMGVIIALVLGHFSVSGILIGAGAGALLSLPVTWFAARRIKAAEEVGPDNR